MTLAGHAKREGSRQPDLDYRSGFGGRFNLPNGVNTLTVALAGFSPHEREFVIGSFNKTLDFGQITLQRSPVIMGTMKVAGQRLTGADTLDRKSFSAAEMIASAAGSALDAMKQLPGVTVDQESKVQLRRERQSRDPHRWQAVGPDRLR